MKRTALTVLAALCFAGLGDARDIRTITGQTYRNVAVTRVDPTGIAVTHADGIAFLDFKTLPPEIQREFGYSDAAYLATQAAAQERAALVAIQQRATAAAAASQKLADEQAKSAAIAALALQQQKEQAAIDQRNYAARDYSARNYGERDYTNRDYTSGTSTASTSSSSGYGGGTVQVKGYYRKDGTYVKGYTRRK